MLEPKKLTRRRQHRRRGAWKGKATRGTSLAYGSVGLKTIETDEITARQIEAARRAATHSLQRKGKFWIRIFPHTPVSKKAAEVPMGSGKGSLEYFSCIAKSGVMIFEIDGVTEKEARSALILAAHKLPVQTKVVTRLLV